jgi:hypothetical protein
MSRHGGGRRRLRHWNIRGFGFARERCCSSGPHCNRLIDWVDPNAQAD